MTEKLEVQKKRNSRISLVRRLLKTRIKPEKFGWDDVAQQIVGAFLFSIPLTVTEEVWMLSNLLTISKLIFLILVTIFVTTLIIYYTKFQKVAMEGIGKKYIPKRLVSLFTISYCTVFFTLWTFGVIGMITDLYHILKLVIFISFFASIGAATADILR